ncbi:unnamed protein product [Ceratitis capitata]|uniref:(Mediterranean fruit fly) hypothetical protein n=1 Tax=Ceratitis capitata TaxID=7213 RepID=A0A811UBL0_CERCA|nr:unnamed protein product [Ceratitis capitata]
MKKCNCPKVAKSHATVIYRKKCKQKSYNWRTWYHPIFATTNPNKPGKIRLVWDAAAPLHDILIKLRVGQVDMSDNIAEMLEVETCTLNVSYGLKMTAVNMSRACTSGRP